MQLRSSRFKFLSAALALVLTISPEMFAQQTSSQPQSTQQQQNSQPAPPTAQPVTTPDQASPAPQPAPAGTTVNPSQPPLQPVTTYPGANETQQDQQANTPAEDQKANAPEAPQPKQQPSQPVGAATAERVPTAGGAAAKPAGAAIAPAKQHQTRSLLIKIGAIAAAGAAVGTIYALSRGTSSTPPNAAAGVQK
jgi:outer membrane biosynthesis protein TonB